MSEFLQKLRWVDLSQNPHAYVYEITKTSNNSKWFTTSVEEPKARGIEAHKLSFAEVISESGKALQEVEASLTEAKLQERVQQVVGKVRTSLSSHIAGNIAGKGLADNLMEIVDCNHATLQATATILSDISKRVMDKKVEGFWQRFTRWICLWWYEPERRIAALQNKIGSLEAPIMHAQEVAKTVMKNYLIKMVKKGKANYLSDLNFDWAKWASLSDAEFEARFYTKTEAGKTLFESAKNLRQKVLMYAYAFDHLAEKYNWEGRFIVQAGRLSS